MDGKIYQENIIRNNFNLLISKMSEEEKEQKIREHGSLENFYQSFKESFVRNIISVSPATKFIQTIPEGIIEKMAQKRELGPAFYKIKKIIKEFESSAKLLFPKEDVPRMLLEQAKFLQKNPAVTQQTDEKYGQGMCEFYAQAIEAYYQS